MLHVQWLYTPTPWYPPLVKDHGKRQTGCASDVGGSTVKKRCWTCGALRLLRPLRAPLAFPKLLSPGERHRTPPQRPNTVCSWCACRLWPCLLRCNSGPTLVQLSKLFLRTHKHFSTKSEFCLAGGRVSWKFKVVQGVFNIFFHDAERWAQPTAQLLCNDGWQPQRLCKVNVYFCKLFMQLLGHRLHEQKPFLLFAEFLWVQLFPKT